MKHLFVFLFSLASLQASSPPSWLKMPDPTEPRPKGVSGWVLHDSTIITQEKGTVVRRLHRHAIMPLSDVGKETVVCSEGYKTKAEEVITARAWAISPDGKKCRAFGGNEFLMLSPHISHWSWDLTTSAYFDPQRYIEPGWIFAWEVEIRSEFGAFDFSWSPESALPLKFGSLEIIPEAGGHVKWKATSTDLDHPVVVDSSRGSLRWTVSDLPGVKQEVPSDLDRNLKTVRAYVLAAQEQAPNSKAWSEVVRLVRQQMDPQAAGSPAITDAATRLVGSGNLWKRIEPICHFVQKEIAYLSITIFTDSMAGYRPHAATDVFGNRYGDCKDKATLLCTMLQAIGVEAHVVLVNYRAPTQNSPEWPSAQFNHAIVAIQATETPPPGWTSVRSGGKDYVLFDPTDDEVPLGLLPIEDAGGLGLVLAQGVDSPVLITAVSPPADTISTAITATLTENGSASIVVAEERTGLAAAQSIANDETFSLAERTGALEKRIQRRVPLISKLWWKSSGDRANGQWKCDASFSADFVAKRMSRTAMEVPTDLLSSLPHLEPWEEGAEGWYTLATGATHRLLRLSLSSGWEFAEVPADWSAKTSAGEGSMKYHREGSTLIGEIHLRIEGGVLGRAAYLDARELLRGAIAAERRPVVLRQVTPAPAP